MTAQEWATKQWTNIDEVADIIDGLIADFAACERERDRYMTIHEQYLADAKEKEAWRRLGEERKNRAEAAEARCKRMDNALQHVLEHGHLAPETERIVREAMVISLTTTGGKT